MPACIHGISPLGACSTCTPPAPRPIEIAGPGGEPLNEAERKYLAMHAHYESGRQDDVRYWDPNPQKRLVLKRRWRQIADWLHAEPWGKPTPGLRFVVNGAEEGRVTAWNAGHVKPVRVVRNTADDQPLVDCPDCGGTASVAGDGSIRCVEVSTCGGGWQVLVVPVPEP